MEVNAGESLGKAEPLALVVGEAATEDDGEAEAEPPRSAALPLPRSEAVPLPLPHAEPVAALLEALAEAAAVPEPRGVPLDVTQTESVGVGEEEPLKVREGAPVAEPEDVPAAEGGAL